MTVSIPFGVGVGDFLAVLTLANKVYSSIKDAPKEFSNISDEVKSLCILIGNADKRLRNTTLTGTDKTQFDEILQGCRNLLQDLDDLLEKGRGQTLVKRLAFAMASDSIPALRARITSNVMMLNSFLQSYDHVENQSQLSRLFKSRLHRRNSVASFASSVTSKHAWKQACRDLYEMGATPELLKVKKPQLLGFFRNRSTTDLPQTITNVTNDDADPTAEDKDTSGKGKSTKQQDQTQNTTKAGSQKTNSDNRPLTTTIMNKLWSCGDLDVVLSPGEMGELLVAAEEDKHGVIEDLVLSAIGRTPPGSRSSRLTTDQNSAILLMLSNAYDGNASELEYLMVQNIIPPGDQRPSGMKKTQATPQVYAFCLAAEQGHTEIARIFINHGVSFTELCGPGASMSALHRACRRGHTEFVRLLLEHAHGGAGIDRKDRSQRTPFQLAVNNQDIALLLKDAGADCHIRDSGGATTLYQAAAGGQTEQVRFLIEVCGLDPSQQTYYKWAPLHWAAHNNHVEIVRILLKHGANPSPLSDTGQTPLDMAIAPHNNGYDRSEVMNILEQYKAVKGTRPF